MNIELINRIRSHKPAGFLIGVGAGALIAIPIAAPQLWEAKLPEGAATLWGAALGALIAVGGAYWAAGIPLRLQRRNAAALVYGLHQPLAYILAEVALYYGPCSSPTYPGTDLEPDSIGPDGWRSIADSASHFVHTYQNLQQRRIRVDSALNWLGAEEIWSVTQLETELEAVAETMQAIFEEASEPGRKLYSDRPTWGRRFTLRVHLTHVNQYLSFLQSAAG